MGVLNLRAAGLIVGVLGSVAGLAGVMLAIMRGEIGVVPSPEEVGTLTVYGFAALATYVAGLVGAMSSNAKPRLAAANTARGAAHFLRETVGRCSAHSVVSMPGAAHMCKGDAGRTPRLCRAPIQPGKGAEPEGRTLTERYGQTCHHTGHHSPPPSPTQPPPARMVRQAHHERARGTWLNHVTSTGQALNRPVRPELVEGHGLARTARSGVFRTLTQKIPAPIQNAVVRQDFKFSRHSVKL